MAYKITWSVEAKLTYLSILEYLSTNWSEREIIHFVNSVHDKLSLLSDQPAIGVIHKRKYKIHKTTIHKHISLIYHINKQNKEITILTFWDTRQNPGKLKY